MDAGVYDNGYRYVRIGSGRKKLLIIPGLNDEIIRATAYPIWLKYHLRGFKNTEILIVSRKEGLDSDVTTEDLADDYREILEEEGNCDVLGISLGGMIAQHLATKTDNVEKLVLGFSGTKLSQNGKDKINNWVKLVEKNKKRKFYSKVAKDTFGGLSKHLYSFTGSIAHREIVSPPSSDFKACARASIEHDTSMKVSEIENDTLVIGAVDDDFFPENIISHTAERIGGSSRFISGRHAAFIQNSSEFHDRVNRFLDRN